MSGWCPYLCVTLIDVFSFLVPNAKRAEWKDHWRQLLRRRFQAAAMLGLIVRCFGAFVHAVWLRKKEWRLEMLIQDLIYGVRSLLKRPGFATISIVVLALGIGANTAIFSVVYSVLLRPLPYKDRCVQHDLLQRCRRLQDAKRRFRIARACDDEMGIQHQFDGAGRADLRHVGIVVLL